jgi:putative intracellular protease/amidase
MEKSIAFTQPISYADASACDYDALMLPGGHDKGVREYLESTILQKLVVDFFYAQKTCRGNMSWYSIGSTKYRSSYQQISNL